jgi:hypothetical protein
VGLPGMNSTNKKDSLPVTRLPLGVALPILHFPMVFSLKSGKFAGLRKEHILPQEIIEKQSLIIPNGREQSHSGSNKR